jgi:hypothetical protein
VDERRGEIDGRRALRGVKTVKPWLVEASSSQAKERGIIMNGRVYCDWSSLASNGASRTEACTVPSRKNKWMPINHKTI